MNFALNFIVIFLFVLTVYAETVLRFKAPISIHARHDDSVVIKLKNFITSHKISPRLNLMAVWRIATTLAKLLLILLSFLLTDPIFATNLFDDQLYRSLIADRKAMLPGDVLTVIVLETSNAQTSADLSSNKEIKTALEAGYNGDQYQVEFGLKGKGNAAAKTGRNGKIKAALTVRIKEVIPNHTYLVEGVQRITINHEQQRILLRGIVRPEDISPQNTILSTRLAQAEIVYTGAGSVSNAQNHNYIYKVLSFMGLV